MPSARTPPARGRETAVPPFYRYEPYGVGMPTTFQMKFHGEFGVGLAVPPRPARVATGRARGGGRRVTIHRARPGRRDRATLVPRPVIGSETGGWGRGVDGPFCRRSGEGACNTVAAGRTPQA
jgi:hypothetical protein